MRDIEEDRHGHVLIATNGGVSKFDGEQFTTLEIVDVATAEESWAPRSDDAWRQDVWIVLDPGKSGPCRYDGDKLYRLKLSKSPAEDAFRAANPNASFEAAGVYSIHRDRIGNLWFGTAAAGLCRYDGKTLSWMYERRLTETPQGGSFGIRSIYQDRAGDFWICNTRQRFRMQAEVATENGCSLLRYQSRTGLPEAAADSDANFQYFASVTEHDSGALWMVCGSEGVWKFDGQIVTRYAIGDGAYAINICCDRQGKLWVGTLEHGVHVFDGGQFEPFVPPASRRSAGRR
ncbi:MAG: two-component regulator propeller domain-containing protein [Planctomycetota bacterium]